MTENVENPTSNEGEDPLVRMYEANSSAELGQDLSEDDSSKATAANQNKGFDYQLDEWNHRKSMQLSAFSIGFTFAFLLYLVATVIGASVAYGFVKGTKVDWHLTLLAAAFIIPPTVIVIVLIRSIYTNQADNNPSDNLPALNLVKEIALALKEILPSSK